jgi:predicted XRE-type DNA-binding protein
MNIERYDCVWDAIEDTPEKAENMRLRSALMIDLENRIIRNEMSKAQAALAFGVTQKRISELLRGRITLFSLNELQCMSAVRDR